MDEIKLGITQHRGIRAAELLENELLNDIFDGIEKVYLDGWLATKARDTDARERLWTAIHILRNVREQLKTYARDGRIAAADLHRLSQQPEKL